MAAGAGLKGGWPSEKTWDLWDLWIADFRILGFPNQCGKTNAKDNYPLVNIQKTMENHHFSWEISL
jgi:hypothetical protein